MILRSYPAWRLLRLVRKTLVAGTIISIGLTPLAHPNTLARLPSQLHLRSLVKTIQHDVESAVQHALGQSSAAHRRSSAP